MSEKDRDNDGIGPAAILATLVGVGIFGGRTGRLALRRMRRAAAWGGLVLLVATPIFWLAMGGTSEKHNIVFLIIGWGWTVVLLLFCGYVTVALWLTKPEDEGDL